MPGRKPIIPHPRRVKVVPRQHSVAIHLGVAEALATIRVHPATPDQNIRVGVERQRTVASEPGEAVAKASELAFVAISFARTAPMREGEVRGKWCN